MISTKRNLQGFTMIEVLVAVVILAVGILGVAGLQGTSLRNTHSAHLRTQATSIARDMVERIRSNRDFALASADNYHVALSATASSGTDCANGPCTATELATYDKNQWLQALDSLPYGNGTVTVNPANRSATITVMWDNDRTGATAGTSCGEDDLTCIVMTSKP